LRPTKFLLTFLSLVSLGFFPPAPLCAQTFSLEIMSGSAFNFPTPLTVRQAGYPDINLTANYDTKPFGPYTPYYAFRFSLWDKDGAWEFEQLHHRVFLTNPPPEIQDFSIHYGYDFLLLGRCFKTGDYLFHADAGVVVTNPENTVRGLTLQTQGTGILDQGYYLSGAGVQAALSRNFYFISFSYVMAEVAFTAGYVTVPVVNGSADVPNLALHGQLGVGFSL
jgi:hypothetical protein